MNPFSRHSSRPLLGSIAALLLGSAAPAFALNPITSATWLQSPGSNDWNTGANWTSNTVPTDTASFGTSTVTTVTLSSSTSINAIVFNAGASAFTISVTPAGSLSINGAGLTNNSGVAQNFIVTRNSSGGLGYLEFNGSASAGGANTIYTLNAPTVAGNYGGSITFAGGATAGSAVFINNGAAVLGATGGGILGGSYTQFLESSTAGSATLIANGGTNGGTGGGIFFFNQATGGTARVIVNGNGFLDISGMGQPNEDPTLTIGSLEGSGNVYLGANNLAVGSNNLSTVFSGVIQDGGYSVGVGGSLTKIGTGSLDLTGANTYTGNTIVANGALFVDGSIVSPGNGNSLGALTVIGNYSQSSSGKLLIGVGGLAPSQHDLLKVGGSASLGGALQLQPLGGFKFTAPGQEVTFLTAALNTPGAVSGKFSIVQNLASFNGSALANTSVVYLPHAVELEALQRSIYGALSGLPGLTDNDLQTAKLLDSATNDPGAAGLFKVLGQANLSQLIKDVELIDPGQLAALSNIGSALANETLLSLEQRFIAIQNSGVGGPAGPDGKGGKEIPPPAAGNRWGSFITGSGDFERVDDTSASRGFNMDAGGVTFGIDYRFTDHLVAGLFGSYTNTGIDIANAGRINVNTGKWGLYGTYFDGGFYVNSALEGGYSSYDNHRNALGGTARSDADGGDFSALFAPGYNWMMGGLTFGPTTRFQYTYQAVDGFTESGSLAPMAIGSQHTESIVTGLGVKASYDWKVGRAIIRPELRLEWEHEYGDTATGLDAQLAGGASNAFRFTTPSVGRDDLHLGAGVAVVLSERVTAYAYYDGQFFRTNYDSSIVTGGFRVSF